MEYSAICHRGDKNYCYAIDKKKFLFRIQVKKNDMQQVVMHYQDKYLPLQYMDTRAQIRMELVASDQFRDYYEAQLDMDVVCLRYFFELCDKDRKICYYGNYVFYDSLIEDIDNMFDCPQNLREEEMFCVPKWMQNKVFYQIFPSRFATTEQVDEELWYKAPIGHRDNLKGNLRGIIEHLDYLKKLGVDVIYMTPIFYSDSSHKYDTIDYYRIDPSFGTTEDLKELVDKAHKMEMRVILDGVFNHTSPKFFAFADIMEKKENSKYLDWYYVEGFPLEMEWGKRPNFKTFSYFGGMPKLNLSNKEVQDYVIDVATYWIKECKIDGWRLDVGDEISHNFWKRFRREVKAVNPEAMIIGEVWHYAQDFLEGDEWDSVMNYPFYDAIKALVGTQQITISEYCGRIGFLKGNYHKDVFPVLLNMIGSHDTERFLHSCGGDRRKLKLAAALQMLMAGMPMIYYGDEVAMEGGADPDCRRGMLWDTEKQDSDMYVWYQKLISIRKNHPCILKGKAVEVCANDDIGILRMKLEFAGETVILLFHCKDGQVRLDENEGMYDLIQECPFDGVLGAYEVAVLK